MFQQLLWLPQSTELPPVSPYDFSFASALASFFSDRHVLCRDPSYYYRSFSSPPLTLFLPDCSGTIQTTYKILSLTFSSLSYMEISRMPRLFVQYYYDFTNFATLLLRLPPARSPRLLSVLSLRRNVPVSLPCFFLLLPFDLPCTGLSPVHARYPGS